MSIERRFETPSSAPTEAPGRVRRESRTEPKEALHATFGHMDRFLIEVKREISALKPDEWQLALDRLLVGFQKLRGAFETAPKKGMNVNFEDLDKPLREVGSLNDLIIKYAGVDPRHFEFMFGKPLQPTIEAIARLQKDPRDKEAYGRLPTARGFNEIVMRLLEGEGPTVLHEEVGGRTGSAG